MLNDMSMWECDTQWHVNVRKNVTLTHMQVRHMFHNDPVKMRMDMVLGNEDVHNLADRHLLINQDAFAGAVGGVHPHKQL